MTPSVCGELVHHPAKTRGEEVPAESSRGASALVYGTRSTQTLNKMSTSEAEKLCVPVDRRQYYFRVDAAKANLAPPEAARWYQNTNVVLSNGENVVAVQAWTPPAARDAVSPQHIERVRDVMGDRLWRADQRANDWLGYALAGIFDIDTNDENGRRRMTRNIRVLVEIEAIISHSAKVSGQRGEKPHYRFNADYDASALVIPTDADD